LNFGGVYGGSAIEQENFDGLLGLPIRLAMQAIAIDFDGLIQTALIGVAHDVRDGFVDRANDFPDLYLGKFQRFHQRPKGPAYHAEQTRMAAQFQL
jgi:hypothetical protein